MGDIVIRAEDLSKRYRIGQREHYKSLRDALTEAMYAPVRGLGSLISGRRSIANGPPSENYIWALKDVFFEVEQGEVVGIIGPNGAGKSTLLKILSRITEPTEGYAEIRGRVGSLLEVGTGFHPELTGRENIYLNGAILGMNKTEIDRKFDEIVAFAEVDKFIDTPIKRYSSGMYLRLAFAVAAHLEPEILVVDEVLAVGDAAFQKKCFDRIRKIEGEGRTVLLVSHNMGSILSLCGSASLLDNGRLICHGSPSVVVQRYAESVTSPEVMPLDHRQDRLGDGSIRLVSLKIESTDHDKVIRSTSGLTITIGYRSKEPVFCPRFRVGIYDYYSSTRIFLLNSDTVGGLSDILPPEGSVRCVTGPMNLMPGRCYVHASVLNGETIADYVHYAACFDVSADNGSPSAHPASRDSVLCVLPHKWFLNEDEA